MNKIFRYLIHLPIFPNVEATKNCEKMAWLFSISAVSIVAGVMPVFISTLYLPICGICLLYIIAGGIRQIHQVYVIMYVAFGVSALFASEPFFSPIVRYALFIFVSFLISPCISSKRAIAFRALVYRDIMLMLIFLTIGSFFAYFWGINLMNRKTEDMLSVNSTGLFGGLYIHSMMLGPLSALVALVFLNCFQIERKRVYIILFFISASAVVLSASRGATLSLVVPIVYSLIAMKDLKGSKRGLVGLLVAATIISVPIAERISYGLIDKQQRNEDAGGTFNSRDDKWENRIDEFRQHPLIGIGFCSVDLRNCRDYNSSGGIEPGSTHLSILSMTGVLGFIPYVLVLLSAYKSLTKEDDHIARIRMCWFLAMITHAFFEGHGLFAGGFLFLMYWLVFAQCEDYKYIKARGV